MVTSSPAVLAVITARGGSKTLRNKNLAKLGGKPLIAWTIDAASRSQRVNRLILSSDDSEIIAAAQSLGCDVPFTRSDELATDVASSVEVVCDALVRCPGYDYVVLLQPTSPLRSPADIDGAVELCMKSGAPACVAVCRAEHNPLWTFRIAADQRLVPIVNGERPSRRQDLVTAYSLNGAAYVASVPWLLKEKTFLCSETIGYEMPRERSIDIDTEFDLLLAELLVQHAESLRQIR